MRMDERVAGAAAAQAAPSSRLPTLRHLLRSRELGVLLALLLLGAGLSVASPVFLTADNLLNIGRQVSLVGIMAAGMAMVIIAGEIDLSVGSVYGLGAIVTGLLLAAGHGVTFALLAGVCAGGAAGLVNGALCAYGRLPSFIVTLGSLSVARGVALIISAGMPITLGGALALRLPTLQNFFFLAQGHLLGIPMQLIFFIVIALLAGLLLGGTVFGFHVYAVGGSDRAARAVGIPVEFVKLQVFVIQGALAAFAGALNLGFLQSVQATAGAGLELDVIAAVIIGGTKLIGGEGTMWGTVIGVVLMGVLRNGLVLLGIPPFWQTTAIGCVIVLAVGIDKWLRR